MGEYGTQTDGYMDLELLIVSFNAQLDTAWDHLGKVFKEKMLFVYFLCIHDYLSICLCTLCIQYPQRPEEGIRSHGIQITDGCEPPVMGDRK